MNRIEINEEVKTRLDQYLSEKTEYSRSQLQKMIKDGLVLVNDKKVKSSYILKIGDVLEIDCLEYGEYFDVVQNQKKWI